jgi:pimeloyl-ACP methyl ester carboxylesterase
MNQIIPTEHFIKVNNIVLHYVEYEGDGPVLLLMHGLTANARAFDGIIAAGLSKSFRIISPDLRGRGKTDHPAFHYTFEDHAKDIIGLMDHLGLQKVLLGGHSYGGLLSFYMGATYAQRVEKLVILDAAARMNSNAAQMLSFAISRFNVVYPSFEDYVAQVKLAPYIDFWDDEMLSYYRADVKDNADGTVQPRSNLTDILEISSCVANISWPHYVQRATQPALLLNALDNYTLGEPLLPDNYAKETVAMMKDARYVPVDGNHQTMLYGDGAKQIQKAIVRFINPE